MEFVSLLCLVALIILVIFRASRPDLSATLNRWILAVLSVGFGIVMLDHLNKGNPAAAVLVGFLLIGMVILYRVGERRDQNRIKRKSHYVS